MRKCPHCQDTAEQIKHGVNKSGSQRFKCKRCNRAYTPASNQRGYPQSTCLMAIRLYLESNNFRQIARILQVSHVSVMNWVKAHSDQLPPAPLPEERPLHVVEMDELHTFVGRKNRWYISTFVERASSCIVGFLVSQQRDESRLQGLVDQSPPVRWYYSDLMASYKKLLYYPGKHSPMPNKSETYRVEGMNAELRHYLARLQRRSRCFSRCADALERAIKLFT